MKSKAFLSIAALGAVALAPVANAGKGTTLSVDPTEVRTYCNTQVQRVLSVAADAGNGAGGAASGVQMSVGDNNIDLANVANAQRSNEVVWQVIGALPQSPPGEGYCGYLEVELNLSRSRAQGIQDCVAVVQFAIASSGWKSASLHWEGATLGGVYQSLSVSVCKPHPDEVAQGNWVDNYGAADCIIDGLDFAGGAFASILDVQGQKADNNVGLIGGVSDLTFLNPFPVRDISLNAGGVDAINAAAGGTIDMIVRCADSAGNQNGFSGGRTNAMVIHDPPGLGFGAPGSIRLDLAR